MDERHPDVPVVLDLKACARNKYTVRKFQRVVVDLGGGGDRFVRPCSFSAILWLCQQQELLRQQQRRKKKKISALNNK